MFTDLIISFLNFPRADFDGVVETFDGGAEKVNTMNKILKSEFLHLKRCLGQSSAALQANGFFSPQIQQRRQFSQEFWTSVSNSAPVTFGQEAITQLHDTTGMPWWSTIIVSTVLLRGVITFPLAIYQSRIMAKVEKLTEEMPALVAELKGEAAFAMKKYGWTEKQTRIMYNRSLKKQWDNLIVRDNCHPAKSTIVLLFQIPLWITQSWAIRNLIYMQPDPTALKAQIIAAEMMLGGFGWVPNLAEVDHSLILPVTLGLLNLTIIEVWN